MKKLMIGFIILSYTMNFIGLLTSWAAGDVEMNKYYNIMSMLTIILTYAICNEKN